jgi:hypothetical protein
VRCLHGGEIVAAEDAAGDGLAIVPTIQAGKCPDMVGKSWRFAAGGTVVIRTVGYFLTIHEEFPLPGLLDPISGEWHVQPSEG